MAKPIRLSIRTHVVGLLLVLLGVIALVPGIVAVRSTQDLVDTAAASSFDSAIAFTVQELHRLEETARAGAEALAANPITQTTNHAERTELLSVLATVLRAGPGTSAAYVGWPDGDFVLLRPLGQNAERLEAPDGAEWLAQFTDIDETHFSFLDENMSVVERRERVDFAFDPRARPWFRNAISDDQTIVTAPYTFFTTREPGISAARHNGNGAVAGVDVSLWALSSRLPQGMPTPSSEAAILDANGDVLAYTDVERLWTLGYDTGARNPPSLPTATDLGSPAITTLAERLQTNPEKFSGELNAGGRKWLGAANALDGYGTMLLMASPTDELEAASQTIRTEFLLLFGLVLVLALPFIWLASRYVAKPVAAFADEVKQAATLDFAQRPEMRTRIRELLALDQAIAAMCQSLRGFTAIFGSIAQEDETSRTLGGVLDALIEATGGSAAAAWLTEPTDGSLKPAMLRGKWADMPESPETAFASLATRIAEAPDVIELTANPDDRDLGPLLSDSGPMKIIGIPLRSDPNRLVGVIAIASTEGVNTAIPANVLSLARFVMRPVAMAIDRQRLIGDLAATRAEADLILNSVADGLYVLDAGGNIVRANPASAEMLGWSVGELAGHHGHALIHHHRADGTEYPLEECPIYKTLHDGKPRRVESEVFFCKDGSHFVVDYESAPLRNEEGTSVGTVLSFRDVTARDRWQRELRERIKEMRCLYRVVQLTSEPNRPTAAICNEIANALPAGLVYDTVAVARIVLDGHEYISANWRTPHLSLRTEIGDTDDDFIEVGYSERRTGAGESPFLREEREMLSAIAAHIWYMQQSRQLNAKLVQLERLKAIGQLTGGVAHDFNNLLTVVLGNAEALEEHLQGNAELYPMVESITMAACRGADLTKQLLAFARQQPLSAASTDIGQLLKDMQPLLHRTLSKQIEVRFEVAAEAGNAIIDATQLENAILNLCLNARDAMAGSGQLIVETWPATIDEAIDSFPDEIAPGQYVCIAVSDTGSGMEPATRNHIFEPFFTTKEVGKGSGLGLSMVYGFVKQSNGFISVYSEPGHGTTIKLYLPRATDNEQQDSIPAVEEPVMNGGGMVLLVEDDEMVRTNIAAQLRALGYHAATAETGPEALALVTDGLEFDLLLTDLILPGNMTGQELAKRVRERHPDMPVVLTSGYAESVMSMNDSAMQDVHMLSKPYRRHQLADTLQKALNGTEV